MLEFATLVTQKGLEAPGDSQELRHDPELPLDTAGFPPVKLRGMFGLAQHYGIPTRLLDWTWKPLVAAYFAALEPARRELDGGKPPEERDGLLAVWAHAVGIGCTVYSPRTVPRSGASCRMPRCACEGYSAPSGASDQELLGGGGRQ